MPRPPEITTRAAVSSGRSDLDSSAETKRDMAGTVAAATSSMAALPPSAATGIERGGPDGDDLLAIGALHRRERVAGVDRAHEGVGVDHVGNVADRLHVEQGGDARHDVLADGAGRCKDMVVVPGHADQQCRERLGQRMGIHGMVGLVDLADARQLGGGSAAASAMFSPATSTCTSPSLSAAVTALREGCLMTPFSWSSRTSAVMSDHLRFGAQLGHQFGHGLDLHAGHPLGRLAHLHHRQAGLGSTPRSAGLRFSIGFLRAFMMLGSDA